MRPIFVARCKLTSKKEVIRRKSCYKIVNYEIAMRDCRRKISFALISWFLTVLVDIFR